MSPQSIRIAGFALSVIGLLASSLPLAATDAVEPDGGETIDVRGFLYGRVESRQGTFEGRLRWGDEEAAWDDHLNGNRHGRPFLDQVPADQQGRRRPVRVFGINIGSRWESWDSSRLLVARFGAIASLERRGRRHILVMKGGSEVELKGGSNDLRGRITVWDREKGETALDIAEIDRITFLPTPADLVVEVHRLYGTVITTVGSFSGHIQWDNQESLSIDILDGDDPEGTRQKLPFGDIRRIARRSDRSAEVTLADGRTLVLDGTNDVNSQNRGIVVEDARYGRVEIRWSAFDRVDLEIPKQNGKPYEAYADNRPLRGTVTIRSGRKHSGRIVYDIDEAETWDFLNGSADGIEYNIPFDLVRSIERLDEDSSRVRLVGDIDLELTDSVDVGGNHSGVLIIAEGGQSTYVPWLDVRRVDFEK